MEMDALKFARGAMALCPPLDTDERVSAIADFSYNCGLGALEASTLRRRILAHDWDQVPVELRKWVHGGGRVLPGLVRRREAEIALLDS
jgi:lysozyme